MVVFSSFPLSIHTFPSAMQPLEHTATTHTDSKSLHNAEAPVYLGAGGFDPDRLERLRSRVAVDSRGRLLDAEMEKHRKTGTRKIDVRAVTPLLLMWLANFIDRTNIGNARIAGMEKDLGLKGLQFNTCLAVFYIFYILAEIPSNLVLKRIGANLWLPAIIIAWGTITTLTGIVKNYAGLLVIRSLLGATEGGLLPGMTLYLSTLYPRGQLQKRIAYFYAGASVSGAFGGLLAYGLTHVTAAIPPLFKWSWIFIVEGILTVAIGFFAAFVMPRSVETTKCLTEQEREACLMAMSEHREIDTVACADFEKSLTLYSSGDHHGKEEFLIPEEEQLERGEFFRGLTDIQVWLTGIAYLCICNSLYSFTLFLPTILAGLYPGSDQAHIQLLSVPPFVPAAVLVIVVAYFADRYRIRTPFILGLLPISMVGYIMLIASVDNSVRYAAVFLVALGIYPSVPCLLSILPNNFAGHYKKATAIALQLAVANCAGFVASFIYIADKFGPNYVTSHAVVLASLVLAWILLFTNMMYCRRVNQLKEAGKCREAEEQWRRDVRAGKTQAPLGDRAVSFRYVL